MILGQLGECYHEEGEKVYQENNLNPVYHMTCRQISQFKLKYD